MILINSNNLKDTAIKLIKYNLKINKLELEKIIDSLEFIRLELFLLKECYFSKILLTSPYIEILRNLDSFFPFLKNKYNYIELYFQRNYIVPSYLNAIGVRKFPSLIIHLKWKIKGDQYFLLEGLSFNPQKKRYLIDVNLLEDLTQDEIKKILKDTL